jgi:hypothetical protein
MNQHELDTENPMEDFTKTLEDALGYIDDLEDTVRESADMDGESGSILLTLCDGRIFRVNYARVEALLEGDPHAG